MEIGQEITVGRMGQQPLPISDTSVSPQHITLKRLDEQNYQITDLNSERGVFVFGFRIERKRVQEDTPFMLGTYRTTIAQLMHDARQVDLQTVWNDYDNQKRKWDRYTVLVNSIRMLTPILTMVLTGLNLNSSDDAPTGNTTRIIISVIVLVVVLAVSIIAGEIMLKKKNLKMAELNSDLQRIYLCPRCQRFLGFVPYSVLKSKTYCPNPNCGVPLP